MNDRSVLEVKIWNMKMTIISLYSFINTVVSCNKQCCYYLCV